MRFNTIFSYVLIAIVIALQLSHHHLFNIIKQQPFLLADKDRYTEALYDAIYQGDINTIEQLIQKGADINVKLAYREGQSPLSYALASDREAIFYYLIEQGGDINIRSDAGESLLHKAASTGSLSVIRFLLSKAMDVNDLDDSGRTPLFYAVRYRRLEVVQLLHAQGGNLRLKSSDGENLLHEAVIQRLYPDNPDIVIYLLQQGVNVNGTDRRGNSVLLEALMRASPETIQSLLAADANINYQGQLGNTALMLAVGSGRDEIADLLLDHGANPDLIDESGEKAIDRFSPYSKNKALYTRLVKKTKLSKDQQLLNAIKTLNYSEVKALIDSGMNVNHKTSDSGNTATHWAVIYGDLGIVKLWIAAGADLNVQNDSGYSIFHQAIVSYPMQHSPDLEKASQIKAICNYLLMFPDQINPDLRHFNGETALYDAVKREIGFDIIKKIIALKPDMNLTDHIGLNVIHVASKQGNLAIVKLLVNSGADINASSNWGYTPLSMAAYQGHIEVVRYLLAQGADSGIATQDGKKPWQAAVSQGHWAIARLLFFN